MAAVSDDQLTRKATQGDRQAFEAIYERYHRDLYRFCLAMLGNPQDAQDTLQNAMIKVLRALPGEERHIQLKPWLYRIARNEAVETMRRRRDSVEIEPQHTVSTGEVADTVEARERLRRLFADLEELPERQRAALVMRELADLGFEQIGEAFETSAAVARQTVYEARLSLRQMEAGREMSCDQVMRELSDADGRVTRRRELRAHLRNCQSCRAFYDSIEARRSELAAIAPLPVALSAAMLHGILSGKASAATLAGSAAGASTGGAGAGGGIAGTIGAGAGKAVATSAILKSVAAVAVVAAVGVGAANRSGLIHVPLLGGSHSSSDHGAAQPPASGGSAGEAGTEHGTPATRTGKRATNARGHGRHGGSAAGNGTGGSRRHSRSQGASHAAAAGRGRSHSHGNSHAGGAPRAPASSHGKATAKARKPTARHPSSNAAGGSAHSRSSSHGQGTVHRHRSTPRHPPAKPRPPEASPPSSPRTSHGAAEAGASSAAQLPTGQ